MQIRTRSFINRYINWCPISCSDEYTVAIEMGKLIVVLCMLLACALGDERPSRLVNIAQGPVRGYKDANYDVYAYYSIPYATTPTGRDRFKVNLYEYN